MDDNEISKMLEQYQKMMKMFTAHMKECSSFKKKVLEEVNFDE